MLDTTCPNCGSTHARKLSLIYEEGRTTSQGSFESVGKLNTIGGHKITTTGTAAGIHQTDASRAAAPPSIPAFVTKGALARQAAMALGIVIGVLLGGGVFASGRETGGLITTLIIVLASVIYGLTINVNPEPDEFEKHREKHRSAYDLYERWEKSFACNACGHRFVPSSV